MSQAVPRTSFPGNPLDAQATTAGSFVLMFGMATELDVEGNVRPVDQPRTARTQPFVGQLDLPAIPDRLRENAELVADAIADGGNLERRQRIEVARRQATEATVAEPRLVLLIEQHVEIEPEFLKACRALSKMPRLIRLLPNCGPIRNSADM
jgi:hypothetical protein